jgi:hypothetical protein
MRKIISSLLTGLCLLVSLPAAFGQEAKISVLNPKGTPPPVPLLPLASRPSDLDGKTVYFIDNKYPGGASLIRVMMDWFTKNRPKVNLVVREKAGSYDAIDAKLWAEIKEKADGVIMAIGH